MASSRDALGALLEEGAASSSVSSPQLGHELEAIGEPVPSLASLLLSTAESLATRSKALGSANSSASTPKAKPPPAFASVANPAALLATPASKEYLASLLALPLPTLLALPNQLATLSTSLDTDLSSLAFTRYSSFLLAHSATQSISSSFSTLSANLDSFIQSTDALKGVVAGFEQRVSEPRRKRERMALVRERMEEVEELMEAPSVVDACVRAGYWAEAIDVAMRLSDLHKRLSTNAARASSSDGEGIGALRLLERVREEVSVALLSLRARVLDSLLQRGLKLPGAVRGVSILRRIGERGFGVLDEGVSDSKEMDEDALRIVFLAARWRCLRVELESVEGQMAASGIKLAETEARPGQQQREDPDAQVGAEENEERTRWTKRWIEVWREVVGETVGMYTEVFLSSTPLATAASANTPHALPSTAPLALFLTTSLNSLSDILSYAIPCLTSPSSLSSLLTQLSYCSHSFARHGLEFRELQQLRERVEARVGRIVVVEWEVAGRKWEKEWRDGWEGSPATSAANARRNQLLGGRPPISDWLVSPEGLAQVFATLLPPAVDLKAPPPTWHHQPSQPLALLPPLARFLNAHATALNALRLLPPLALYPSFLAVQARELDRATQVLAAFTDAWLASLSTLPDIDLSIPEDELSKEELQVRQLREDEKRLVVFAVAAFGRWVVPWCEGGLKKGVYGELAQKGMGREEREQGVVDAIRRVEGIVARIEGRPVTLSPTPAPVKEMPPTLDLLTSGDPGHLTERSIDTVASPSAEVTPIPFDPAPLDEASVDPAIVEASIVADDHAPEPEPPTLSRAEQAEAIEVSAAEPAVNVSPVATSATPTAEHEPRQSMEKPSADDLELFAASEPPSAGPAAEELLAEEAPIVDTVIEQPTTEAPAAIVSDAAPSPLVDPTSVSDPALVEEATLDAPIEDLDVDKMPLDHPLPQLDWPKISVEVQREEPAVEIAVEKPAPLAEAEPEQEEPAVTSEGMEQGGEGDGEDEDAWFN